MKLIKTLSFLFCMLILLPTTYANNLVENNPKVSTITVQGSSSLSATPDQATIMIGIVTSAPTASIAEQQNADIATNIQNKLIDLGIDQDNISTTRYTFYPTYDSEKNKNNEIIAYNVNNSVSVTINDLTKVGNIIDASIQAGANTINSIDFTIKNDKLVKQNALQSAVKDAKSKAEIIAKTLDKRIVNVLAVNENGTSIERHNFSRISLKAGFGDSVSTPITPGDINVNANVEVVFVIE